MDASGGSGLRTWWTARRLRATRRALEDAIYNRDKWGFADRPSEREDREAHIHKLIRRLHALGGDVFDAVPYDEEYLISDALPELYEWKRQPGNTKPYWRAEPRT